MGVKKIGQEVHKQVLFLVATMYRIDDLVVALGID